MKIAIVNDFYKGGAAQCAQSLEKYFSKNNEVRYYPRTQHETANTLLADLSAYKPDIVHCHTFYHFFPYNIIITLSNSYPTVWTIHDISPCANYPMISRRKWLLSRTYKMITHLRVSPKLIIVTPSLWIKKYVMATELKRFIIEQIPNGVDTQQFHRIQDARVRLNLSLEDEILLYVAYSAPDWDIIRSKGLNYLIEAFLTYVIVKYPNAKLIVVGEGRHVPEHPNLIRMSFIPHEELPLYYSACNVFVAPSLQDNLPYVIMEAMACETPVISTAIGGIPELIDDNCEGLLIPPTDIISLGKSILSILSNPQNQIAYGKAGRAKIVKQFNIELSTKKYNQLYQRMCAF